MLLGRVIHSVRQGKKQFDMKPEMKKMALTLKLQPKAKEYQICFAWQVSASLALQVFVLIIPEGDNS